MKILAFEEGFPPELTSARLPFEFADELANRGHEITVVTVFPRRYLIPEETRKIEVPKSRFFYWENMGRFLVLRVRPELKVKSLITRFLEYSVLPITLFIGGLIAGRNKDLVHCQTPPLTVAFTACLLSKILRKPIIIRIQDIHPDALIKIGLLKNRLLIKLMEFMELFVYVCASHITVISYGYRRHVLAKGINSGKVSLIPNWANIDKIKPPNENDFRERMRLGGEFLVTYAGTISWPQDLETVVEAANILRNHHDIRFLIVGDGAKKEMLIRRSRELRLDNIIFMPLQPRDEYFKILYASGACIVPLRKQFTSPTLPSKMLEIMACGKPIIANVPSDSDVRKMVENVECGVWVEPEKPKDFSKAVLALHDNRALAVKLGENGLFYLRNHLTLKACMDRYEKLLNSLVKLGK
jgi:colanic acid biosynthesis glycosyl transferase WcaI